MNKGLSKELNESFPNTIVAKRPIVETLDIPNPNWISGFSCGESCFDIRLGKSVKYATGYQVQVRFRIAQDKRDLTLLGIIASYLGCGTIQSTGRNVANIEISNYKDLVNIIIPFFNKYPILGSKFLDFEDFCRVAELMKNKAHLTKEGLEEIKGIKSKMNTLRTRGFPEN